MKIKKYLFINSLIIIVTSIIFLLLFILYQINKETRTYFERTQLKVEAMYSQIGMYFKENDIRSLTGILEFLEQNEIGSVEFWNMEEIKIIIDSDPAYVNRTSTMCREKIFLYSGVYVGNILFCVQQSKLVDKIIKEYFFYMVIIFVITILTLMVNIFPQYIFNRRMKKLICKINQSNFNINSLNKLTYYVHDTDIEMLINKIIKISLNEIALQKELEAKSKFAAIGQTTSMLAQDVKKPFTQIQGILNMMDKLKQHPSLLEEAKRDVEKSVKNVQSMISDVMDFSREVKLETEAMPIANLLDFSVRQCAHSYKDISIDFVGCGSDIT